MSFHSELFEKEDSLTGKLPQRSTLKYRSLTHIFNFYINHS